MYLPQSTTGVQTQLGRIYSEQAFKNLGCEFSVSERKILAFF